MKATELIAALEALVAEHGDIPVVAMGTNEYRVCVPSRVVIPSGETAVRIGHTHRLVISACGARVKVQVQSPYGGWKTLGEFASEAEAQLYAKRLRGGPEAVRNRT